MLVQNPSQATPHLSKPAQAPTTSVLILQRILPPYRLRFFQQLSQLPSLQVTIAYGAPEPDSALENVAEPTGLLTMSLDNRYFQIGPLRNLVFQRGIIPLLRRTKGSIIIAEFNPRILSNVLACVYAWWTSRPFIWWGHGFGKSRSGLISQLRLWLVRLADALVLYGDEQASEFLSRGVPPEKIYVATNSIDVEEVERWREERPREERNGILFVGRLIPEKKVDLLVHAFALAQYELAPGSRLVIIGDGPERCALEQLAKELQVESYVTFAGAAYEQEVLARYFNSAWVSISPGYVGLSAVHSLAYGLPLLVARDEPHAPEVAAVYEGVNGYFFPSDNAKALAASLVALSLDNERWEEMAEAAHRVARERLGIANMLQAFEQAIRYAKGE